MTAVIPPTSAMAPGASSARAQSDKTIVDVAIAAGSFKTLVAAARASPLTSTA